MMQKLAIQKVIVYILILAISIGAVYLLHMREVGYTDKDGNVIRGTNDITAENKEKYMQTIVAYDLPFESDDGAYMTFRRHGDDTNGRIDSIVKVDADFSHHGADIKEYMFDIYFADSSDYDKIRGTICAIVPSLDPDMEFGLKAAIDEFNSTGQNVTRSGANASFTIKPLGQGYQGAVVSVKKIK